MMRRVLLLLPICVSAHAALPVYNTDQIAEGEVMGEVSFSRSEPRADTEAVIAGNTLTGHTDASTDAASFQLAYGFSRRLTGYIAGGYGSSSTKESLTGPATVESRLDSRGWNDVGFTVEYLVRDEASTPLVARLVVVSPTASDFPAQSGITVNGAEVSVKQTGSRGSGQTVFVPQLAGSVKGQSDALEWSLFWRTDDDASTEDDYQAVLGWVHGFSPETHFRLSGTVYFLPGMNAHGETTNDLTSYAIGAALDHQLGPKVSLVAAYTFFRPDSVRAVFSNGNVSEQRNQTSQQVNLGFRFLFN